MKNSDKSAMPNQAIETDGLPTHEAEFGLTKREMMAMHMMCAMMGAPVGRVDIDDGERLPLMAIVAADALLAELEKSQ